MTNLIDWHKSSYSYETGACVEAGTWTKSSASHDSGHCVEVRAQGPVSHTHHTSLCVGMRDTTQRELGHLEFNVLSFASLLGALK